MQLLRQAPSPSVPSPPLTRQTGEQVGAVWEILPSSALFPGYYLGPLALSGSLLFITLLTTGGSGGLITFDLLSQATNATPVPGYSYDESGYSSVITALAVAGKYLYIGNLALTAASASHCGWKVRGRLLQNKSRPDQTTNIPANSALHSTQHPTRAD